MESAHRDSDLSPEAARMLREMALRDHEEGGEPDLPDEQLRANDQLQQDEMLVLEAIYGDKICVVGEKAGPRSFQIQVHCEIPDGISVSVEPFQGVDDDDPKCQFLENFSVEHLAPLSLTCLMPPSYPSHRPPYFTLGVQWLDNVKVSSLCHMLDSIWAEQPGQEVVYGWVQWLQSSMLSHLGFDDGLVIQQPDDSMVRHVDVQVVQEIVSVGSVVEWLISYNEEQCHESFLHGLHACMICFSEYTGTEGVLQKALDSMADVAYCPRCGVACLADEDIALCSKCVFHFCPRCSDPPHIGRECIVPTPEEKLLTLQERSKVYIESRKRINLANEIRSIREVLRSCVPCPHCGIAISRVSGCDHMVCRSCGNPFNYAYRRPENERAVDFIKVEPVPIEQRRVLSLSVSSRQYPCPKCHRPYPKMGNNNHIWCLACQVHYCALCRKVVRKISEHYGPRGCKQHTVDPEIVKTKNKDDSGSELL